MNVPKIFGKRSILEDGMPKYKMWNKGETRKKVAWILSTYKTEHMTCAFYVSPLTLHVLPLFNSSAPYSIFFLYKIITSYQATSKF